MRVLTKKDRQKILTEAKSWLGVPYKIKGKDRNGIDCSQLVMAIYRRALGLDLIRDQSKPFLASWIFFALKVIKPQDLQIGDLVFYCPKSRPKSRLVTSVAIYIGDGQVIHANCRSKKVVIELISDYHGLIVTNKDEKIIDQWLKEFEEEFPDYI